MDKQSTLEQMIADKAGESINQLISEALEFFNKEKNFISFCDEVAYPASMIADMTGHTAVTIHNWFDSGKLTNVAKHGTVKKAKFKQFKHLIAKKEIR